MIRISILSMFPEMLKGLFESPLVKRAIKQNLADIETVDIKQFADGSFRAIDDSPYGGSHGMIMRMEPLVASLESVRNNNSHAVLLSPKGKVFNQEKAKELSKKDHLIIVCGHYEGTDSRFDSYVDEQISLGDFVLSGGEVAAVSIVDSLVRLLDGTLKGGVTENESHENHLLEHPQYTHPFEFRGQTVPEVLLSGDTKKIQEWKHNKSIETTKELRPDMLKKYMQIQIEAAEESFRCHFSQKDLFTENILKYTDSLLPDMYDHNFFRYLNPLTEKEVALCEKKRKEENQTFIKFQGNVPLGKEIVQKFGFEENCILTMALFDTEIAKTWNINKDLQVRNLKKFSNGKDFIDFELRNYKEVYGEDFATRKTVRYLKACNKQLDFAGAYLENQIISSLYVWQDFDCVLIDGLTTAEEFRHQKAATTLLSWACSHAPFAFLHADNDDTPKEMYKNLGFKTVSKSWEYFKKLQ